MSAFSENLRYWRNARGLSQRQIAKQLGMEHNNYGVYETGTHEPRLRTLVRISTAPRVPVDTLLPGPAEEIGMRKESCGTLFGQQKACTTIVKCPS